MLNRSFVSRLGGEAMVEDLKEVHRLQECIDDLVALVAMPAMWNGCEPDEIVSTLLDVLCRMLHLDFAYARMGRSDGYGAFEAVRSDPVSGRVLDAEQVGRALEPWIVSDSEAARRIPHPDGSGEVCMARF